MIAGQQKADFALRVVLAYEDLEAVRRAHRACGTIASMGKAMLSAPVEMWQFDLLRIATMRDLATQAAATCDLVVLAPQNHGGLPEVMLSWIRAFLRYPDARPKSLLVLQGPGPNPERRRRYAEMSEHPLKAIVTEINIPWWNLEAEAPYREWAEPSYNRDDLRQIAQTLFSKPLAAPQTNPCPTDAGPAPAIKAAEDRSIVAAEACLAKEGQGP
jgi:hypothetical protein